MSILPSFKLMGIAAGVSLVVGLGAGWKAHDALVYQPHLAKDAKQVAQLQVINQQISKAGVTWGTALRDALDQKQIVTRTVTNTLIQKVPEYVDRTITFAPPEGGPPVTVPLDVSNGFVRLHNYAASGVEPPSAPALSGSDLTRPSGLGLPAVSGTIVSNYGRCLEWRNERDQWREYAGKLIVWWDEADKKLRTGRTK